MHVQYGEDTNGANRSRQHAAYDYYLLDMNKEAFLTPAATCVLHREITRHQKNNYGYDIFYENLPSYFSHNCHPYLSLCMCVYLCACVCSLFM